MSDPIRVFAPARVDLSAGFTDVAPFSDEMPSRIVNVTLDIGVEVAVRNKPSTAPSASFASRLRDAIALRLAIVPPSVALAASPLPPGSGLGASGALTVALAYALSLRAGSSVEAVNLVELACAAERDVGLTGGTQDQLASVHGGAGVVRRHRDTGCRESIAADLEALGERLVLVHGSGHRNSGAIIEQVLDLRSRATVLRTIKAMNEVGESLAHSLRAGDHDGLAALVNESTALLGELHPPIVDDGMNRCLRELGASAAKPCGAGGSGAAWLTLVDPPRRDEFAAAVTRTGLTVLSSAPNPSGAHQVRP